ncbi:unnamed protein product [Discosporangium mesarthrocarpum]
MDKDGSGEIDATELAHPLLSTGIARSSEEVQQLVRRVDKDGSGEIGFPEFMAIIHPPRSQHNRGGEVGGANPSAKGRRNTNKIARLQEIRLLSGVVDMSTAICMERRLQLIHSVMDEASFRRRMNDEMHDMRNNAESNGNVLLLKELEEREKRLEERRKQRNLYVSAVEGAMSPIPKPLPHGTSTPGTREGQTPRHIDLDPLPHCGEQIKAAGGGSRSMVPPSPCRPRGDSLHICQ